MNDDDIWYFAYGSNMDRARKERRTARIREARVAYLLDYCFAFNKRGSGDAIYANIVPRKNGRVWGVIYLCGPQTVRLLDGYEGVAGGHYVHEDVTVTTIDGEEVKALTYVAGADHVCEKGYPSPEYLNHIVSGAQQHGLPRRYIRKIESLGRKPR